MKYALITGASGGLGGAACDLFLARGYRVFGLNRSLPKEEKKGLTIIPTDITDRRAVEAAFEKVKAETDRLDVIVNTSGIMFMGSFIEEPAERLQNIFNVNVFGMCLVNEVFLPLVERGKGRIINFSSEYGTYTTVPFNGFYTLTKHAVEVYSEGLRRELCYLGIPVIVIRPGAFKTKMESSTAEIFAGICQKTTHYQGVLKKLSGMLEGGTKNAKDPRCSQRSCFGRRRRRSPSACINATTTWASSCSPNSPRAWWTASSICSSTTKKLKIAKEA